VKIDRLVVHQELADTPKLARETEELGFNALLVTETNHDPFLPLGLAAEHTATIELGTAIAIAFARNPMTTAMAAWDLQRYSQGRFRLGLGSQVKPHIENRFSMPWSRPVERMHEFVSALRAIWDSWQHGTRLDFRGDFYQHTLMTPFFNPGANEHGAPVVFLAAVGERMTRMAAEVGDGLMVHGLSTERYMREAILPTVEEVLGATGRSRKDFELSAAVFVVTGLTEQEFQTAAAQARRQLAFYASTPSYRPVLERHGWGDLQEELNGLSKRGAWEAMGALIDDEMLATFAVVGDPDCIAGRLTTRFGGVVDRISPYLPAGVDPYYLQQLVTELQKR
jgi:probable F420-dependent oxidoreductase